ncbi:4039_t:CDS:2, partial [Paraglomus brasilianum]
QYIRGLNPMNQYNVRMMAKYHDTRDNITKALVEAEKFSLLQGNFPFPPSGGQVPNPYEKSINTGLTETEVKNLIKSMIPATQSTASKPQEEQSNQITLSQNDFKKLIAGLKGTIAKGQQTLKKPPGPGKQKADELAIDRFLDSLPVDTSLPEEAYDYDPIEDLRKQFEDLDINQAKLARIIHAVLRSSQYKCSKCDKTGHNSRNCPKNKKKSKSRRSNRNKSGRSNKRKSKKKGSVNITTKSSPKKRISQKKSGTIIDSQIRKIILAMFNDPEVIETIKNNINNTNLSITRRVAPKGPAKPDFINYREPAPEIPESDDEEEMLNDPMAIDF